MRFGFQRNDRIYFSRLINIRLIMGMRSELHRLRPIDKRTIVFISGNNPIRIFLRSFLNQFKECTFFLFSVDNKGTVKNFMTAVFRIDLRKTEYFGIGQFPS